MMTKVGFNIFRFAHPYTDRTQRSTFEGLHRHIEAGAGQLDGVNMHHSVTRYYIPILKIVKN